MEKPLTIIQRRILRFIADFKETNGYSPSIQEIGKAVGLSAPSSVHYQLTVLQDRGKLTRSRTARSISLTGGV